MTEKRERYRISPSQAVMAMTDEFVALNWLTELGSIRDEELLGMYWDVVNRTAISGRELTELEQYTKNRAAMEMLRRVDNQKLSPKSLPSNVYKTWCKIMYREPPSGWWVDCGQGCQMVEPFGWVPEAGCPVHDADDALVNDGEV